MQRKLAIASALLALGSGVAHAQTINMAGSDTLHDFTVEMLTLCPGTGTGATPAGDLNYVGGGSSNGENAITLGTNPTGQWVAPMSRNLKTSVVSGGTSTVPTACNNETTGSPPGTAQGIIMGLDGVSVVRRESSLGTTACDTLAYNTQISVTDSSGDGTCPGCTGSAGTHKYTFPDWRDVLRVVYGGFTHNTLPGSDNPYNPCKRAEPGRDGAGGQDCKSDVRVSLVNSWSNLFQNQSCADKDLGAGACTQLKHAFRRSDASGTTDVFTVLLSMPKQDGTTSGYPNGPYCSGMDQKDNDPIRRACGGTGNLGGGLESGEQVCQAREFTAMAFPTAKGPLRGGSGNDSTPWKNAVDFQGDLGLVQTILVPEVAVADLPKARNITPCKFGTFGLAAMPDSDQLSGVRCPNGTNQVLLKCLYPKDASGNYGCLNSAVNVPPIGELQTIDGRAYNKVVRYGNDPDVNILADKNGVQVVGGYYRLHQSTIMPGASAGPSGTTGVACNEDDSTSQIGCLVQASPCSIGFAGREAADKTTIANNDVRSLSMTAADATSSITANPTNADVRLLLSTTCTLASTGTYAQRYPLSRRLWLNTLVGFSNVAAHSASQDKLATCWKDRYYSDFLIKKYGFVTLDDDTNNCAKDASGTPTVGRSVCQLPFQPASTVCQ